MSISQDEPALGGPAATHAEFIETLDRLFSSDRKLMKKILNAPARVVHAERDGALEDYLFEPWMEHGSAEQREFILVPTKPDVAPIAITLRRLLDEVIDED
jgi:hypothetical protein